MLDHDGRKLSNKTEEFLIEHPHVRKDFVTFLKYMASQALVGKDGVMVGEMLENTDIGISHMVLIVEFLKSHGVMAREAENPNSEIGEIEWVKT